MKTIALLHIALVSLTLTAVGCAASTDTADEDTTDAAQADLSATAVSKGIVLNESILGMKIGSTREEVRAALGAPTTAKTEQDTAISAAWKTYTYGKTTTFIFVQDAQHTWRATTIKTTSPKIRFEKGNVGIGSTKKELLASFPILQCIVDEGYAECEVGTTSRYMNIEVDATGHVDEITLATPEE